MRTFRRTRTGLARAASIGPLVAAALVAVVVLAGCRGAAAGGAGAGAAEQGFVGGDGTVTTYDAGNRREVPSFTGTTLAGEPFDFADLRGDVVVLNVWGSWCAPCRAEAPALERVHRATRSDGVRFVGLNVKDNAAEAALFADDHFSYPSVDGNDGKAQLALRGVLPGAIPSTIVVDREGRLAAAVFGAVREPALRRLVQPLAAEGA